jgi:cytochrome c5
MTDMSDRDFSMFVGGLVAMTFVLFVLANMVASLVPKDDIMRTRGQATPEQSLAERIKPVGQLMLASSAGDSSAAARVIEAVIPTANAAESGKQVYDSTCHVCHGTGVAGAPKFGDHALWKDRIAQGKDTLYTHAINGYQGKVGFMPPKGGNASLSDADIKAAVDYMVSAASK